MMKLLFLTSFYILMGTRSAEESTQLSTITTETSSSSMENTFNSTFLINSTLTDHISSIITTTAVRVFKTVEPPPTRSAQLGMGFGISFISILLIGEIVYFKYFYRRNQRNNEYPA
ncbi:hypothetical protein I4U23_029558 [Adineta vaga]|nr:hypothetical protein I4U23_029558 [Adineta vaga]